MRRPRASTLVITASVAAIGLAIGLSVAGADPSAAPVPCDSQSATYDPTTGDLTYSGHCVIPPAPATTVTETGPTTTETVTQTETDTATVTQTVPGPTTTVTVTATPTPTPTPTPPPGQFAPGQAVNASNTGYAGDGLTAAQLVSTPGTTYGTAFNGQTISGKAYTGRVNITGSNITVKDCSLTTSGSNAYGFDIQGTGNTVDHCTVTTPTASGSMYEDIMIEPNATNATVSRNDLTRGENLITTYGASPLIANNYLHNSCGCGDPDGLELYGGTNTQIINNRINYDGLTEAPINIAPYNSYKVNGVLVQGNFLDRGQSIMILDNQNSSCPLHSPGGNCMVNITVEDNAMGGHQCPASNPQCFYIFHPTLNDEGRPFVQTAAQLAANPNAVLWPTTGPDVNRWEESADIETASTPQDGDVVDPTR